MNPTQQMKNNFMAIAKASKRMSEKADQMHANIEANVPADAKAEDSEAELDNNVEVKAMKDELNNLNIDDPEEFVKASNKILENHTFKDVFKVFSAMYEDSCLSLQACKDGHIPMENAEVISMLKDSFELEALKKIFVDKELVLLRKDAKYFSRAAYKKGEKAKDGVYERLLKRFSKSNEHFPDIKALKNVEFIPDMTKNVWRYLAMALDAIVTEDKWVTRARYVKQVMINASLVGLFYAHGGEKLYEDEENPNTFNCMKTIIKSFKEFNDVVVAEIGKHPEI